MSKNNLTLSLLAASLLAVNGSSLAATSSVVATVTRVLVDGGPPATNFGGCMALLSVSPTTKLPTCGAGWVTFSCTGTFANTPVQAYRLLDQAQLALAGKRTVTVFFRDDMKHNGYCFANRVDVQ